MTMRAAQSPSVNPIPDIAINFVHYRNRVCSATVLPPARLECRVSSSSPNRLLASLAVADFALLQPHLKPLELRHAAILLKAGQAVEQVYFPHSGIISLVVELSEGMAIEAAMIGRDSMLGATSAMDGQVSLNTAIIQLPGTCETLDVTRFREAAEHSLPLRTVLLRHEQVLFAQAQQSAACNASHHVEARMCRWLLRARDLSGSDTMGLTQEFLAEVLGVQRGSVSPVAGALQRAGLIRYSRGHIEITDVAGLWKATCECYGAVKAHYDRLLNHQS
jgi:CRP-like cAMP-binding protein